MLFGSNPREEKFPFRKIVLGNFPGPVRRGEGEGAAERKEYKIKSGVARERAKSDGEGIREGKGDRSLSLEREARPSGQESAIARSVVSLAPVSGWLLRPTFLHLAGE